MSSNLARTVYLDVYLDAEQRDEVERTYNAPSDSDRVVSSVRDDYTEQFSVGNEYLIHLPVARTDYAFKYTKESGRLSGYFEIWDITGPR